jgi:hypothetical protein
MKKKLNHILTLKSTYVILISQIILLLQIFNVIDIEGIKNTERILTIILETCTILGFVSVYNTKPETKEDYL